MKRLFVILGQNCSMRKLVATSLVVVVILLGSVGTSWSTEPIKGFCLAGTKHAHAPFSGKCSSSYESGDYAAVLREWTPLAKQGDADAQYNLGGMYFKGQGILKDYDYKTAAKWYTFSAKQGNAKAQYKLGYMYDFGLGVPKDHKTAVKWLTLAAKQGDADAHKNLGQMYEYGRGVSQDYEAAVKWYTLAAKQGNADAQFYLGGMYKRGDGVPKDYMSAVKWYTLAARQGEAYAQNALGRLYQNGGGVVTQDYGTAVKWYTLAAIRGNAFAQRNLGQMYEYGRGVSQDYEAAVKWYTLAAKQGNPRAQSNLRFLQKKISKTKNNLTVTAKKHSSLSSTAAEFENKRLRRENARLRKQNQPKPKQVTKRSSPKPSPPTKSGSTGSGFFVSKLGHVVTNAHVVRTCGSITVGDSAKKQVTVTLLETDKRYDLALLKISSTQMASVETKSLISKLELKLVPTASKGLLRSDDVELGEDVLVSGYPYGNIYSNTIRVTKGIVSANRGIGDDIGQFQIDATFQPGNSGGPIYDINGNIVGVLVSQLDKLKFAKAIGSLPENVNFGIKASTVRQFLTASGLPTKWSQRSQSMPTKELAKIAKNQTVMVVCNR